MMLRRLSLLLATVAGLGLGVVPANATQTDPVLEIARAVRTTGAAGSLVQLDATFPMADQVQRSIGLQLLVRDLGGGGTRYVRFPLGGDAVAGDAPALADGLDPDDVAALLAEGEPLAGARVLFLGEGRIDVWLPPSFAPAAAEVQIFLVYEGDPILSNPALLEEGGS